MRDYSVYDITPPSLYILASGPNVYMSGMNEHEKAIIKNIFESSIYDTEIAFYYNDNEINSENLAWTEVSIQKAGVAIFNVENITPIEQYLVDIYLKEENDIVIYYSKSGIDNTYARLLASNGEIVLFDLNEIEKILKNITESE